MSRIDEMLAGARAQIVRYTPAQAWAADDVLLVDLRPDDVRAKTGVIPGAVHVARSGLEWRADPTSEWHDASLAVGKRLVLICAEGYSSSLAAASLMQLGVDAGDLEGGFDAWVEAGLPVQ